MTRQQVSEEFSNERLQTQARPIAQTVIAPQADPSKWRGLANVFAQGEVLLAEQQKVQQENDRERATAYASSMTVAELGRRIKAGDMLTSESPVFAATVQHVWGQNTHAAMEREVLSKVTTGELKFKSPEEIDTYLTESRNTALSGASEYAVHGFDKGYQALRGKLMDSVAKVNDKEIVENAANQASDFLGNKLLQVTSSEFKGTPQDAAKALLDDYHLMRHSKVMPDAAAKGALQEVVQRAASGGQKGVLEALLNSELPDVGSVRSFLGETRAQTFLATAGAQFDKGQRQRVDDEVLPHMLASDNGSLNVDKFMGWAQDPANKDYLSASTIHSVLNRNMAALAHQHTQLERAKLQGQAEASVAEARRSVDAALAEGKLWRVQGTNAPKVLTDTGRVTEFNVKEYAEQSLAARTANLPFGQQVSAWAFNGLRNPNWANQLQAGLLNLSSIGVDSKGKPTGQLNEAGTRAIELFKQLDAVNPDAAKLTAGESEYKRFSDIAFLMHLGREPSDAASIANNAAQGATFGSPADVMAKKVASAVGGLMGTPWTDWFANRWGDVQDFGSGLARMAPAFSPLARIRGAHKVHTGDIVEGGKLLLMGGEIGPAAPSHVMRNSVPNTSQVHGMVQRYATLLAHSGQVGDPESALKLAVSYISRPEVSAQVNGTLYLRSELPAAPSASRSQTEWLEKFIDEVPKARAKELGFPGGEVRLEYDERIHAYRAFVAGLPLMDPDGGVMMWQKGAIQQWYAAKDQIEMVNAAAKAAESQFAQQHSAYRNRLSNEIGDLQAKEGGFVIEKYDGTVNRGVMEQNIWGKDAFKRITADGNADKPLGDLLKLYPSRKSAAQKGRQ